ncbi:MAG: phosphoesterase [Candidatus Eremiobacter antarcticus]|nr:metallophosphoesterase family protein [Candidatus Eremiobacteraeota bacterium]MBC5807587.1 metallophosphoesterase family protein [Candidatus Eremiobacteraeota bacterium]PZR61362.1 MAG: phosphoesterase [Candidatus Eremiobacter sp. RRmetagenome_bin22]
MNAGAPEQPSRIAALYDIHGNLPALEAVLSDIEQARVDRIVVGGDVVMGPMPRETLARLLDLAVPVHFIQGNCDREVASHMAGVETGTLPERFRSVVSWVAAELGHEHGQRLSAWPLTLRLDVREFGHVLFCHATPRDDTEVFTRDTPEDRLLPVFEGIGAALAVCGHTHMQFDRNIGDVRVVNAGSVGMPFGLPGAHWLLLGPDVELRHTAYDLSEAADRVVNTEYPQANNFAEHNVLHPPSEEEMLAAFSRVELKS